MNPSGMVTVRLLACAGWLASVACGAAQPYRQEDFAPVTQIEPQDRQLLESAARASASDIDPETHLFHGDRDGKRASAWYETFHKSDPDGAERWKSILCSRGSHTQQQWRCSAIEEKGVRVTTPDGTHELMVSIPLGLSGEAARRMVKPGLVVLPRVEVQQACDAHEIGAVQQAEAVKLEFAQLEGKKLRLDTIRGGFGLFIGASAVFFDFDLLRDPEPRIRCWGDGEEIEEIQ